MVPLERVISTRALYKHVNEQKIRIIGDDRQVPYHVTQSVTYSWHLGNAYCLIYSFCPLWSVLSQLYSWCLSQVWNWAEKSTEHEVPHHPPWLLHHLCMKSTSSLRAGGVGRFLVLPEISNITCSHDLSSVTGHVLHTWTCCTHYYMLPALGDFPRLRTFSWCRSEDWIEVFRWTSASLSLE